MAELILVKNNPEIDKLLQTKWYKSIGSDQGKMALEDFTGARAVCTVGDDGKLEYLHDYLHHNCIKFANNLKSKFNVFWIEQSDLLEYNQHFLRGAIPFEEFKLKIDAISREYELEFTDLEHSELLWEKMNSVQKAKILPLGYLRNYLHSIFDEGELRLNISALFHRCIAGEIKFGIPKHYYGV
ncbi:MAG: hypothetical protein MI975_03575 [Cytophagales bacterium]|nr:hypothetical protein [Cytophagales bacterium]